MSFDSLAPHYRWMEAVLAGNKLQFCRTAFLSEVQKAGSVLILGEGNGRFLLECKMALGSARITCVDGSLRMIELARRRMLRHGIPEREIEFVHTDALAWIPPAQAFDVVVTHFFLDCFRADQLQLLLSRLAGACRPRARWLLADFQIPERGIRRWRARLIHYLMYAFFRVATRLPARCLSVPDPLLQAHGFVLRRRLTTDWGLLRSDLWELV